MKKLMLFLLLCASLVSFASKDTTNHSLVINSTVQTIEQSNAQLPTVSQSNIELQNIVGGTALGCVAGLVGGYMIGGIVGGIVGGLLFCN